jgi:hypothetical protein
MHQVPERDRLLLVAFCSSAVYLLKPPMVINRDGVICMYQTHYNNCIWGYPSAFTHLTIRSTRSRRSEGQTTLQLPRHKMTPLIIGLVLSKFLLFEMNRDVSLESFWSPSSMTSLQALHATRWPKRGSDTEKRIKNTTWWARCVSFIHCISA